MKEGEYTAYCMRCKEKVVVVNPEIVDMKGKGVRKAVKGTCLKCNTNVFAILKNR